MKSDETPHVLDRATILPNDFCGPPYATRAPSAPAALPPIPEGHKVAALQARLDRDLLHSANTNIGLARLALTNGRPADAARWLAKYCDESAVLQEAAQVEYAALLALPGDARPEGDR